FPELSVGFQPSLDGLKPRGVQAAGSPLSVPASLDKPGRLQHFQVPGNRGHAYRIGQRKLADGRLTLLQSLQNASPNWVCKSREKRVELCRRKIVFNSLVI